MKIQTKERKNRLALPLLLLFLIGCASTEKRSGDELFLWKVSSKKTTVYLLGTIHVLTDNFYPLPDTIEKAFEKSNTLALELDPEEMLSSKNLQMMFHSALFDNNRTLKDVMTAKEYRDLAIALREKGVDQKSMEELSLFKPWFLSLFLTTTFLEEARYTPDLGIDFHFFRNLGDRNLIALESVEYQVDLFSKMDEQLQVHLLLETVKESDSIVKMADHIVELWKRGDTEGLSQYVGGPPFDNRLEKEIYYSIYANRNHDMAKKIEALLKKGEGPYFVAVGAGHFVGKESIIATLKKNGWQVNQLTITSEI